MRIEYHRTLIADRVRLAAFHEALSRVIVKGRTTVADIGTGTGVLAFLAARLGARKVHAYETAEIGAVAEKLKALNRMKAVELIPGRSTEIIEPPQVDVVVTETLGNFALEEFLVETMNDARARYLKPGGTLIPTSVEQFACPVTGPRLRDSLCVWDHVGYGLDFAPAREMSLNNVYIRTLPPEELLDQGHAAQRWDRLDFHQKNRLARRGEMRWAVQKPVTVHGLAVWWTAELVPGVSLSTSPLAPPTHWEQLFFPALEPIAVAAGEALVAEVRSRSSEEGGTDLAWSFGVVGASGKTRDRQALSLAKGFLP
ncbi:MAG: 50S ribosomal protein L11 methyltransferase [Hyphomicrobiaceae bacterium]|nr:50S ribosomal protein L11 methyltransferase [Hyphomicrobiaceae bacterium]